MFSGVTHFCFQKYREVHHGVNARQLLQINLVEYSDYVE